MPGMRSHHMNHRVRISREQGHAVDMLVSSHDQIGQDVTATRGFAGLQQLTFNGPPAMGTADWASKLSPDSAEVC